MPQDDAQLLTDQQRTASPIDAVELADAFGHTAKLLGSRLTDRLANHGLSMPRFHLLVELARHGPLRLTELGSRVGISQGTASTLAEALVRDGLIKRSTDPHDRRATELAITESGHQRAQAWLHDYELAAQEIFAALPADQWSTLLTSLRTLSANHPAASND